MTGDATPLQGAGTVKNAAINNEHCVIGIDIGTGSLKAVAVYSNGFQGRTAQRVYETRSSAPGFNEQDPEEIWTAFIECLTELLEDGDVQPGALAFSSAMHSLVAVDATGTPITPLIIWSDARSARIAEALKASPEGEAFYTATGTPIHAMTPLCKIRWLQEAEPRLFPQVHKFISIKEYIWWKLFGVYEIDHSIASATGMFGIETLSWHGEALGWAGISPAQLSTPVATGFCRPFAGNSGITTRLPAGIPLFIGASDGCLANLGTGAMSKGIASITIGSSGAIRVARPKPILTFPSMPFAYRLKTDLFICGGPVNNGGIVIRWLLQTFYGISSPTSSDFTHFFDDIEPVEPGAEGLLFLPHLTGERAPVWDARSCGTFFGLKQHHTTIHMMRAAVEGVCFALNQTLLMLEDATSSINEIIVSGGFIHSNTWLQILADITGKPLHVVEAHDASATGAAFLAMEALGLGYVPPPRLRSIEPDPLRHQQYQKYYAVYTRLYPSLKEAMHALHQINH